MISIPIKLAPDLKKKIRQSYKDAIDDTSGDEVDYVKNKIDRVLNRLAKTHSKWMRELYAHAFAMRKCCATRLLDAEVERCDLNHSDKRIVAALFYLCNPYDIIPDHIPGEGYVDDAIVLNTCLKDLKRDDYESYQAIIDNVTFQE